MNPLWSGGEPKEAAPDPEPPRRHARLYEAEYAKQLRRIERIRKAVGGGDTPAPPREAHSSWDEPPAPAPRIRPPEEDTRPAGDPQPVAWVDTAEPVASPPREAAAREATRPPAAAGGSSRVASAGESRSEAAAGEMWRKRPADEPPRAVAGASPRAAAAGDSPRPAVAGASPRAAAAGDSPRPAAAGTSPREAAAGASPREAVAGATWRKRPVRGEVRPLRAAQSMRREDLGASRRPPRIRSIVPRAKRVDAANGNVTRLAGGWKPPRPEAPVAAKQARPRAALFASGLAVLGVAALAVALLASRDRGPQPVLLRLPSPATDLVAGGGRLWAAAPQAGAVWILDGETGAPLAPALRTGGTPARIAVAGDGAWAADTEHGALVRLQRTHVWSPVPIGPDVADVAIAGGAVWAASAADGMVRVLPAGGRRVRTLPVGGHPVALAADARSVVVASADGAVAWFDARTRRSTATIHLGGMPIAAAMDRGAAWIADAHNGTVQSVGLEAATGTSATIAAGRPIPVGPEPVAIAARDGFVYVACGGDRTLAVVDENKRVVTRRVALGVEPAAIAVDGEYVWIAAAGRSALARIDRRRLS